MDVTTAASPLRVLFVEDAPFEVELATQQLRRHGLAFEHRRVETEAELRAALVEFDPHIVLSDFSLPRFDGLGALRVTRELAPRTPLIFLSGTIGEERAIDALHRGAVDYILKGNLARLPAAVRRAIDEADNRARQLRQATQIARLNRVLAMLGAVNGLALRLRNRGELLSEACSLAVRLGGYGAAVALLKSAAGTELQVRGHASDPALPGADEALVAAVTRADGAPRELVDALLADGIDRTAADGERTLIGLPLVVDRTPIGALLLCSTEPGAGGEEELQMLRELAGNLSFGLQYLQTDSRMRFLSHFDVLTGLARRTLFCQRLQRRLGPAPAGQLAVTILDIEKLGAINTSFGRRIGDLLLQHVADRLKGRVDSTQDIAHFGGGTFATFGETVDLLPAFADPVAVEGHVIPVTIRAGVAQFPGDGLDASTLVQNAEEALMEARTTGQRQSRHRADRHSAAVARLDLEHRLRNALERQQYDLHYQAKVDVRTRRVQGVEALLRWHDPERGLVAPGVFLPILESTGLIVDVGRWVIGRAARDYREWLAAGLPAVRIAVNIAPVQIRQPDFVAEFLELTQGGPGLGAGIDIEITESALREDGEEDFHRLAALRAHGVKIAVDDFGVGYSSLSRLAVLPVDTLKIDRSFVSKLGSPAGDTLVRIIIDLARALRMTTVAEGVETGEQLDLLRHYRCDQSQGYLHSRPVPREAFATLLAEGRDSLLLPPEEAPPASMRPRGGLA